MDFSYLLLLQHIRELSGGIFNSFMLNLTSLGTALLTYLLLAAVYWCVDKRSGQLMALNISFACTLNQFAKNMFKTERPWIRDSRIEPVQEALSGAGGYSFPSGHTTRATANWGALGSSLGKLGQKAVAVVCWLIVICVAFSRNYLGVHTVKDVLAALLTGIALIVLLEKVMDWVEKKKNRDLPVLAAGFMICFLPMLRVGCLTNAGAGMGFLAGWWLERHFVNFEPSASKQEKCIRFAVGSAGIAFIITVFPALLGLIMEAKYAGFFSNFALGIFIMAVYPFFFCKRERYKAGALTLVALLTGIGVAGIWLTSRLSETENTVDFESGTQVQTSDEGIESPEVAGTGTDNREQEEAGFWLIAHRGYSSEFPENTMSAFAGALDIGVDCIELDVQMTKDGEIVVFHDDSLLRVTGEDGAVADYTGEELRQMDAGGWFDASYQGERIPTLKEALDFLESSGCQVYLELKDIGETDGFEEAVLSVARQCGMTERCIFASFQYRYLSHLKGIDARLKTLYNTTSASALLPEEFPADYYGLYVETLTSETVKAIHGAGGKAFVWTVDTPEQLRNVQAMGADGAVTNEPGLMKVAGYPEYDYLVSHYESSVTLPGLYEAGLPGKCEDMVVQGLTRAGTMLVVSAYSRSGAYDSILYVMDAGGKLIQIVDLGFKAHTGGVAYDGKNDLLWITGAEGQVYALRWSDIAAGAYKGEILVSFDAQLVNHAGSKVASFLNLFEGELFVGSYVNGAQGVLKRYDISDVTEPRLKSAVAIPERIQGITFKRDVSENKCYMLLSQGYQTEDSHLLKFVYKEEQTEYLEPVTVNTLPEGVEQIQMTASGMYILFESAARPYRATARIPNDQIWLVRE